MKTVFLLRHAKSDWGDAGLKDQDRRLSERGRDAAPRMGEYISAKRYRPDAVLCSTARRTVETCDLIKSAIGNDVQVQDRSPCSPDRPSTLRDKFQTSNPRTEN